MELQLKLLVCLALVCGVQARHSPGPGPARAEAEEAVCCSPWGSDSAGPPLAATPTTATPDVRPSARCCGKGWGLHCCRGDVCCLGPNVVRRPAGPAPALDTAPDRHDDRPTLAPVSFPVHSHYWHFRDWASYLNITIVILVIALVSAVLVCCCRRDLHARRHRPLADFDNDLYSCKYGTVLDSALPGHRAPTAPMTSRWVDFSYKGPTMGTPLWQPQPGHYNANPRVSPYYPGPV